MGNRLLLNIRQTARDGGDVVLSSPPTVVEQGDLVVLVWKVWKWRRWDPVYHCDETHGVHYNHDPRAKRARCGPGDINRLEGTVC